MNFAATFQTIKSLASDPVGYWNTHKVGSRSVADVYMNFLIPLVLLGAIAEVVQFSIWGIGPFRAGFFSTLINCLMAAVLILAGFFVEGIVIEKIAPKFGGSISRDAAIEFVALACSLALLAKLILIVPFLGWLKWIIIMIASIYSFKIFWDGIPSQTGVETAKRPVFLVIVIVCMAVFYMIAGQISTPSYSTFTINTPQGTISSEEIDNATKQLQKMMGNIGNNH